MNKTDDYYAFCSDDKYIKIWNYNSCYKNISCNNPAKQIIQFRNKKNSLC